MRCKDYRLWPEFYSLGCFNQILVLIQEGLYNFTRLLSAWKLSSCLDRTPQRPVNLNSVSYINEQMWPLDHKKRKKWNVVDVDLKPVYWSDWYGQLAKWVNLKTFWPHKLNWCFKSTEEPLFNKTQSSKCSKWLLERRAWYVSNYLKTF